MKGAIFVSLPFRRIANQIEAADTLYSEGIPLTEREYLPRHLHYMEAYLMNTTQEERIFGGLAHLGVLFNWIGLAFMVVLLVIFQPRSRFIASHVKQALGVWVGFFVLRLVVSTIFLGGATAAFAVNPFAYGNIGGALAGIPPGALFLGAIGLTALVFVIMALVKGINGQPYKYPIIGDLITRIAGE